MKKPKMILFDFGHTLLAETKRDGFQAEEAILQYAVKNLRNYTAEQVDQFSETLINRIFKKARECTRSGTAVQFRTFSGKNCKLHRHAIIYI